MTSSGAPRSSVRRRYAPSSDAQQLAHELALVTGRLVQWSYDARRDVLWWSDDLERTFHLEGEGDGDGRAAGDPGRWLVAPLLAGAAANPGPETEVELYRTVNDGDGQEIVLLVRGFLERNPIS